VRVRADAPTAKLYKSEFDPTVNVGLRHSFNGGHYRRGGLDVVKDAQHRLRRRERARVLDNIDPLAKLAAKMMNGKL
jgi:hypothetical protein